MIHERDHIILTASYGTPTLHRHLALHLLFGLDGQLDCRIDGQEILCDGICIGSNVYHTVSARKGKLLMVLVEASSELAWQMRRCYLNAEIEIASFAVLPEDFVLHIREAVLEQGDAGAEECIQTLDGNFVPVHKHIPAAHITIHTPSGQADFVRQGTLMGHTAIHAPSEQADFIQQGIDERIRLVLKWIQAQEGIDGDVYRRLVEVSCLSLSRLSHLFKEQTGSSLSGYLAWVKLEKAYASVLAGNNLTQAAVNAGFSSPSHMSATIRRMFGITFSDFLASV